MLWTPWNNGRHLTTGAGYGLKVPVHDRDAHMARQMRSVILMVPTESGTLSITFNIDKDSFWMPSCHKLISRKFGGWLIARGLAPWPCGVPPRFEVEKVSRGAFALTRIIAA